MAWSCPVCGGLVRTSDAGAQCENSHQFDPAAFEQEKDLQAVRAVWAAARALEDHASALRWSARQPAEGVSPADLDLQADGIDSHARTIREIGAVLEGRKHPLDTGLRVASRRTGTEAVVECRGDIDILGAPRLRDELSDLADAGVDSVEVDLTGSPMIDSSGLAALVIGRRRFERFAVRGLNEVTRSAFVATGLDLAIQIVGEERGRD